MKSMERFERNADNCFVYLAIIGIMLGMVFLVVLQDILDWMGLDETLDLSQYTDV